MNYLYLLGALLPGGGFTFIAVAYFRQWRWLRQHGQRAVGTVAQQRVESTGRGGAYVTRFRFTTASSEALEIESGISLPFRAFRVGEAVTIYYDPAQPQEGAVDSRAERVGYVVLALVGCLVSGLMLADVLGHLR